MKKAFQFLQKPLNDNSLTLKLILAIVTATTTVLTGWLGGLGQEIQSVVRADENVQKVQAEVQEVRAGVESNRKQIRNAQNKMNDNKSDLDHLKDGQKKIIDRLEAIRKDIRIQMKQD